MAIWKRFATLDELARIQSNTLGDHLGVRYTEIGDDFLRGTLPVDSRTVQPLRRMHGGALVALAEELGSAAANLCLDASQVAFGLDINANHVRGAVSGLVTGTARPLHLGRSTQIWEISIVDDAGRLVSIARLTMAVLDVPTRSKAPDASLQAPAQT
jgi:1,4-dihydroxy-2-naphthoyl-CoA hydrolase